MHAVIHALALVARLASDATPLITSADSLAARILARISMVPGAEVGVAYRHLGRPDSLFLNADSSFHAASTMKVPVMIELFRQTDAGGISLEQPILLVNQFGSIVDGSPFSLDPGSDSDSALYAKVGDRVPLRELVERMITRSSNLATNAVIALVGAERVQATMRELGVSRMRVLRGVEDGKAYERGLNNTATARDLLTVLAAIENGRAASRRSCAAMLRILLDHDLNTETPARLHPGTAVAHRTGQME